MNMSYEMFLTIQLMHLTCRKDRIQSPTRKEGWDLFQRTSDDSSRFIVLGLSQKEGIDYEETFAATGSWDTWQENSCVQIKECLVQDQKEPMG